MRRTRSECRQEPTLGVGRGALLVIAGVLGCAAPLETPGLSDLAFPSLDDHPVAELPAKQAAAACRTTGQELESAGHFPQAIRLYERSLLKKPGQPDLLHRLAVLYDRTGDSERAAQRYEDALAAGRPTSELLNDYGYHRLRNGDADGAIDWLSKAVEADPANRRAKTNLAHALGVSGRLSESLALYEETVGPAGAHANVGAIAARSGRADEARPLLTEAIRLDPNLKQCSAILAALDDPVRSTDSSGQ